MSSTVPGRQSAIGLALLFFGPAIAFLFFYSPQKQGEESLTTTSSDSSVDAIYAKARASKADWDSKMDRSDLASQSTQSLPGTSPTKWLMNEPNRTEDGSSKTSLTSSSVNPNSIRSQTGHELDSLIAGEFGSTPQLPKDYASNMVKLDQPAKSVLNPTEKSLSDTPAGNSNGLVPLTALGGTPTASLNRSDPSRFGAGAYRPSVHPSTSVDQFPRPTQLHNNLLQSEAKPPLVPLQSVSEPTMTQPSSSQDLKNKSEGPQTPTLLSVAHPRTIDAVQRSNLEEANRPNLMQPPMDPNRTPQFVRQPKR